MSSDEKPTETPPALPTPEEIKIQEQKAKLDKAKETLGITRINEDVSALREDVTYFGNKLTELVEAINQARNTKQESQQTQSNSQGETITKEETMLLVKDVGGIVADIYKSYKGANQKTQDGTYGNIIMQSLARAFQVHVDDIVYGTLQRLPASAQTNYIPQTPSVQPISNPVRAGFQK